MTNTSIQVWLYLTNYMFSLMKNLFAVFESNIFENRFKYMYYEKVLDFGDSSSDINCSFS